MKKNWVSWLIYISVIFLAITLIREDYIVMPPRLDLGLFMVSLLLLFAGFVVQGVAYKIVLQSYGYRIGFKDSLASFGVSVLSRYMPGKFWVHLSRGGYIAQRYGYPLDEMIYISLYAQFLGMWNVILFCLVGLLLLDISLYLKGVVVVFWLLLSLIIFTRILQNLVQKMVSKTLKKDFTIPALSFIKNLKVFPVFIAFWLLYAVAFLFLAQSLGVPLQAEAIIFFPLSTVIGIAAVFAPGGLGLREASLVGLLTLSHTSTAMATTLAAFSRLWFLAGELFSFFLGMGIKFADRPNRNLK